MKESVTLFLTRMVFMLVVLLSCAAAQATCVRSKNGEYPLATIFDEKASKLSFGRINIASLALQPVGTILGSTMATAGNAVGINDETVMWTCDLADKDQLYEVFSTNGDDRVGGYWDIGAKDGLSGYYQTWFRQAAIKITHVRSGRVFTRYWQYAKLTNYEVKDNKILIKAKHLSPVQAELVRVSSVKMTGDPGEGSKSDWCPHTMAGSRGGSPPWLYTCNQPNAYIAFSGPGYPADPEGSDHGDNNIRFWGDRNGVAFGMWKAASISYEKTCVVRNTTPVVKFPTITVQQLQQGETREADFSIQLECDNNVNPGTAQNQTALGIQVSAAAYARAMELKLVDSKGAVAYLLSDEYGVDPAIATGVGIRIHDAITQQSMKFLGWPGDTGSAGWYPVINGRISSPGETVNYIRVITASLGALPGHAPTPGRVRAIAHVIVKVQ